jgi:hypothetical protein
MTTNKLEEYREKTLNDHLSLGPDRCVSYLPIQAISAILNMTAEEYMEMASDLGLNTFLADEGDSCIKSGAVFIYSKDDLSKLIKRYNKVLLKSLWPIEAAPFVQKMSREWLADSHPVKVIIRRAFGERDVK